MIIVLSIQKRQEHIEPPLSAGLTTKDLAHLEHFSELKVKNKKQHIHIFY